MTLTRQNRTIAILALIVFSILSYKYFQNKNESPATESESEVSENVDQEQESAQESMGDEVSTSTTLLNNQPATEQQKVFGMILSDVADCLDLKIADIETTPEIRLDSLSRAFQSDFGQSSYEADRWMNWHLRMRDGKERRIRLENAESDDGKMTRELKYFTVDRDGQPSTIDMDDDKSVNPSDDVLDQLLKEGDVFYKERAAFVVFPNGERIEYLEKNGTLSEIEIIKGDRYYRCSDISERDSCQCVR
jgi:hypothetical protein